MSKETLETLRQELQDRKTTVRRAVAAQLEFAKSLGDLSENFEYHDAKDKQSENEQRILELESILDNVIVIEQSSGGVIRVGSTFVAMREGTATEFQVVGSNEANPMERKISNESPMGQAFLGAAAGDKVTVQTPSGPMEYTVQEVR